MDGSSRSFRVSCLTREPIDNSPSGLRKLENH